MKLGPESLLEIVAIFQDAMLNGTDASQALRDLDLAENSDGTLSLSFNYLKEHPRATVWPEQEPEEA
jgi:hypothetical protein